jgi:hypothetical protein
VGLACQTGDTPPSDHTLSTVTLSSTQYVDALILVEHTVYCDLLLEEAAGKGHLSCHVASIDLLGFVVLHLVKKTHR